MRVLYARITPPLAALVAPFRVTEVTQWEAEARGWWMESLMDVNRDILMVYFPECKHQESKHFENWIIHQPALVDVMIALEEDKILWKMWSVENGHTVMKTPLNGEDEKFLKSIRIRWEDATQNQSGLHLVRPENHQKPNSFSGSDS